MSNEYIDLKWGTLKSSHWENPKIQELWEKHVSLGYSPSAVLQHDTPEQKEILCQMIDLIDTDKIYLHVRGAYVSKEEAKRYIREYNKQ